ncbi:MAG TPA: ATP-grasp domain-containing protein, partial [bacterium]|nr:ATP-grasp domain-containing protein [bacterium]
VDVLTGVLEPLQEPLAEVRERLQIRGMDAGTAANFRDKARMKEVFAQHGIPCARHRLCASTDEALAFAREVGYPLVGKPPAGAGAKATARCADAGELDAFLRQVRPAPGREVLLEEFIQGQEFSFDTVTLQGRHVFHNVCCYLPTPLEVMENPWIQWCTVLPHSLDVPEFAEIHQIGCRALDALGMWSGLSHMEWFRRRDGSIAISEVAARPPGAQFVPLMGHVLDADMFHLFAELMAFERFDVRPRRFAAGAAYLRAQPERPARGRGSEHQVIRAVHGLERVRARLGSLIVQAQLPQVGRPPQSSYEGDGVIMVRHPDTRVVTEAVQEIVRTVRVEVG